MSFSTWLSWGLLGVDLGLMGWLSWRAYRDGELSPSILLGMDMRANVVGTADTLDRCEVPWFGGLASRILDEE